MADRRTSTRQAEQLVAQGKIESAIVIYERVLKERPEDTGILNTIGDLYVRLGNGEASVPYFQRAAEQFNKSGFHKKAIATLRKAHRQKPNDTGVVEVLAEIHIKEGLAAEAKTLLMELARHHQQVGNIKKAKETYEKIIKLDPQYVQARVKLSELAAATGDTAQEMDGYVAIGQELMESGRNSEALKLLSQAYEANPKNFQVSKLFAELLVRNGDRTRARKLYTRLLQSEPDDPEVLASLGVLDLEEGKDQDAISRFHHAQKIEAKNNRVLFLGGRIAASRSEVDAALRYFEPLVEKILKEGKGGDIIKALESLVKVAPQHSGLLKKLETIYTYLEKKDKLLKVLALLADAYEREGNFEGAISAAERLESFEPGRIIHKDRLERLHSKAQGMEMFGGEGEMPPEPFETVGEDLEETLSGDDQDEQTSREVLLEVEVFLRYGLREKASERLVSALNELPNSPLLHEKLAAILDEDKNTQLALDHYTKAAGLWEGKGNLEKYEELKQIISTLAISEEAEPAITAPEEPEVAPVTSPEPAQPPQTLDSPQPESARAAPETPVQAAVQQKDMLEDQIAEAEYYLDQGFLSPAHQMLTELKKNHPGHPKVEEMWESLRAKVGTKLDAEKVQEEIDDIFSDISDEEDKDDFSSLADGLENELFQLHSAAAERLDSMSDVKKTVDAERLLSHLPSAGAPSSLSQEELKIHFDLGLAYQETGLMEEAINELQLASESPELRPKACLHLGMCFHERGMDNTALDWLKKGLSSGGEKGIIADTLHQIVMIYKKQKNMGELMFALKKLREIAPDHPGLSNPLA